MRTLESIHYAVTMIAMRFNKGRKSRQWNGCIASISTPQLDQAIKPKVSTSHEHHSWTRYTLAGNVRFAADRVIGCGAELRIIRKH